MLPPMTNRGVYPPAGFAESGRFDAYDATIFVQRPEQVMGDLEALLTASGETVTRIDGLKPKFFAHMSQLQGLDGKPLASLKWGGSNPHPHLDCYGPPAALIAEHLRNWFPHRPSRIDHAVDRWAPDQFDQVHEFAKGLAARYGLRLSYAGDWATPNAGRTIYVGSKASQLMVRIYEKGLQYCARNGLPVTDELKHWLRFEVVFKPQSKPAKAIADKIEGAQIWGSSQWTGDLAEAVLQMQTQPISIRERRESNRDRALRFMASQYSSHLGALLVDCKGDLAEFGEVIANLAGLIESKDAA